MSIFIQHLSTILTVASSEYINTGNRVLDNSIIAIITFIAIQTIHFIVDDWKKIYNCLIFHLYNMKDHPLNMTGVPFIHTDEYETKEKFYENFRHIPFAAFFWWHDIMFDCYNMQNNKDDKIEDMLYILGNIIIKNKIPLAICNKKTGTIVNERVFTERNHPHLLRYGDENKIFKLPEGIYLLAIDKQGLPIYYSTDFTLVYTNANEETHDYVKQYIIPVLVKEYQNFKKTQSNKKMTKNGIYVIKRNTNTNINENSLTLKQEGFISAKKTFDTLFYEQKEELIRVLNKFRSGCMYPSHIPMDNKLGIMLYGPPGTGKTGTISAIANYLGRNLTLINFTELTSTNELDEILDSSKYKETIFVFDEFDYLLDALGSKKDKESNEKTDWSSLLLVAEGDERKDIINTIKQNSQQSKNIISVSYLLQKMDGLESADGRMIIATTNNPDKINPALMRPGRFDLKLCLGNCTQDMYGKILENYYKEEKNVYNRVLDAKIPTYKYSPLELINYAMQSETLDILLDKISCECEIDKSTIEF